MINLRTTVHNDEPAQGSLREILFRLICIFTGEGGEGFFGYGGREEKQGLPHS